ncbi:RNA demethylase ALKBH9B-like [Camellia sinensis]|nr:RNA demethylase ALKBH9B-like [Camellia sinensis]
MSGNSEPEMERQEGDKFTSDSKGPCNVSMESDSNSMENPHKKQNLMISPKTFVGTEILNGKAVNVVDGMKLYEELLDLSEVSKLVSLVNDLRAAGKRGQFQGKFANAFSFIWSRIANL